VAPAKPATAPASATASTTSAAAAAPAAVATGTLQLAISPWGEVEIDGRAVGLAPPLNRLTLSAGAHQVVVRNADFPPFTTTVQVEADGVAVVRHRFVP
jgi:serine/threonine-protein kinase